MKKPTAMKKNLLFALLACLLPLSVKSQTLNPLFDVAGRPQYGRDTPSGGDTTNYEATFQPCLKEFVTSTIGFRGYDEGQDWQGLGDAYYYLKFNSSGTCAATDKAGLTKPIDLLR